MIHVTFGQKIISFFYKLVMWLWFNSRHHVHKAKTKKNVDLWYLNDINHDDCGNKVCNDNGN